MNFDEFVVARIFNETNNELLLIRVNYEFCESV